MIHGGTLFEAKTGLAVVRVVERADSSRLTIELQWPHVPMSSWETSRLIMTLETAVKICEQREAEVKSMNIENLIEARRAALLAESIEKSAEEPNELALRTLKRLEAAVGEWRSVDGDFETFIAMAMAAWAAEKTP